MLVVLAAWAYFYWLSQVVTAVTEKNKFSYEIITAIISEPPHGKPSGSLTHWAFLQWVGICEMYTGNSGIF